MRVAFTLREAFFFERKKDKERCIWYIGVALAGKEEEELTERKAEALSGARGDAGCDA